MRALVDWFFALFGLVLIKKIALLEMQESLKQELQRKQINERELCLKNREIELQIWRMQALEKSRNELANCIDRMNREEAEEKKKNRFMNLVKRIFL